MEPEGTGIEEMTERELWQSHPAFRCYDFNLFREYNKNMINLTKKHWKIVNQDKQDFEHDKKLMPDKSITLNGEPFWYTHPAKELLRTDLRDELMSSLDPSALRETRPEYKEFTTRKFCKEVHHEKQRLRAKPFWQWFRNKNAREMHDKQVAELRKEWINDNDEDVNEIIEVLKNVWVV